MWRGGGIGIFFSFNLVFNPLNPASFLVECSGFKALIQTCFGSSTKR